MSEFEIQCKIVRLIDRLNATQKAGILYCSTQGGVRVPIGIARKMVASGYRKGIPDLMIYSPSHDGQFIGLAIELKAAKGRVSEHQIQWLEDLRARGWRAEVGWGLDSSVSLIFEHFSNLKRPEVL
jgi:hypothetical protein